MIPNILTFGSLTLPRGLCYIHYQLRAPRRATLRGPRSAPDCPVRHHLEAPMSTLIEDLLQRDILVLDAALSPSTALQDYVAARPAYVIVQRGDLFYSYHSDAWMARVE